MPNCVVCGKHYFSSPYNKTSKCYDCVDTLDEELDEEAEVEVDHVVNKSRKTPYHIDDDNDTDSFSS